MSATLSYSATQAPPQKVHPRKYASYLFFILCASLYLLPFMRLLLQGTDEGLFVSGAVRVAHGQVFARDFFEIIGPGTFYWLAMFFKIFGVTFVATRICLFVSSLGTGLLMYFLSRRVCTRYQMLPCVILAGTYFGMLWPTISHHVDSNFFALASIACTVAWQDRRKDGLLLTAGVLAAATTCFHQPKGVLLMLALLLWLWIERRGKSSSLSTFGLVTGGYVGTIGLVLVYFWSRHALGDLIYANLLWPSEHYPSGTIVPYGLGLFRSYWYSWGGSVGGVRWTAPLSVVLIVPFLFVAALPALLPVIGLHHRKSAAKPEIVLYWLCGWALWLAEFHRKDIQHLAFGSPLLIILCIHYLERYRAKVADLALQILAICAVCLAGFNFVLTLTAHSVATRVGSAAVLKNDPILTELDDRVAPGEEIFVYPYGAMYYFLSATTNPTIYSGLIDNYNTVSQFQEVVRVLDRRQVRYVVWDTGFQERAVNVFYWSAKRAPAGRLIIEPYLESHYRTIWTDHKGILLMERKSESQ